MITINSPAVTINVSPVFNESSPGTLARLAKLESAMSAETDKVAEVATSVDNLISVLDGVKVELESLKAVAGKDPEVLKALQDIIDKLTAATNPTPGPAPEVPPV